MWVPSQEAFDKLLAWLDPDRERAGLEYENIRQKLILILARRGCPIAEDLAEEAINRVNRKVEKLARKYVGNPALYFYDVAQKVYLEWRKGLWKFDELEKQLSKLRAPEPVEHTEELYECLERCLEKLDPKDREAILKYHQGEKREKIDNRKELASREKITLDTLRKRIERLKANLRQCVINCLKRPDENEAGHGLI